MQPQPSQSEPITESDSHASDNAATADPATIMKIKNLELRARVVVEGFMAGLHRSPYHGFSVEFTDYRQYSVGDDLRYLDWKLLARADRLYIKRFEDETNLRCFLMVDFSKSMAFPAAGFQKLDYARTLAATLAQFLTIQRDAVGVITFAEHLIDSLPPRFRRGHLRRIMGALDRPPSGSDTDLDTPLGELAQTFTKRGMVVLISDLLTSSDAFGRSLRYLRSRGHDILVLRVLAPEEVEFNFREATLFHDLESGKEIYIDPATAATDYRARFEAHESEIRQHCEQLGVGFHRLTTDQPFADALFSLIQHRHRAGRQVRRATGGAASPTGGAK